MTKSAPPGRIFGYSSSTRSSVISCRGIRKRRMANKMAMHTIPMSKVQSLLWFIFGGVYHYYTEKLEKGKEKFKIFCVFFERA